MKKEIKQTRRKIKSILPKWYELKCEIQDKFTAEYPINFKFIEDDRKTNYTSSEINNFMRDKLSREYIHAISYAYYELVYMYSYSLAADIISIELEKNGNLGLSGFWKYEIRNFYFRNFIPRFWSFLDYLAFFIYQLSLGELIPKIKDKEPKQVSFLDFEGNLSEKLKIDSADCIGWLSTYDRKNILNSFKKPFNKITPIGKKILKRYRDVIIHRYLPGIDVMTISSEKIGTKTRANEYGKLFSISNGKKKYDYYGAPEFKFSDLIKIAKILLSNITDILNDFSNLEVINTIVKKSQ